MKLETYTLFLVFPGNDFFNYQSNGPGTHEGFLRNDEPVEIWQDQSGNFDASNDDRREFDDSVAEDGLYWIWNSVGRMP